MQTPFMGMIQYYAFNFAPRGWATCSGQLMAINQNQALFSLLGTQYGGNGIQTFALPDLRGRTSLGAGNSPSGSYTTGQIGGTENAVMTLSNMPAHTHTGNVQMAASNVSTSGVNTPVNNFPAVPSARGNLYSTASTAGDFLGAPSVTIAMAGGSQPISILSPYLALTCCIALTGIFPSRN